MKRFLYYLRELKVDILTTVIAVAGILAAWWYAPTDNLKTGISTITTVIALLIIVYSRSLDRDFIFSALTWRKDKENWIGHGVFQFSRVEGSYEITNADPGYIHPAALTWSNYRINFDFKITEQCIGVLVRAVNLANYIMLQIGPDGIRPHIRVNGGWRVWEAKEVNFVFDNKLDADIWHRCNVECDKNTITISIYSGKNEVFNRSWQIPREPLMFEYRYGEKDPVTRIFFPIALEYGSVGFRNSGHERALVKNVLVEKL